MKSIKFYHALLAMAAIALSMSFTSCDDDDDDDDNSNSLAVADYVVGSHTVYTEVMFTYISTPYTFVDETVTITKTSDNTVDVAYSNDTWGDWTVSDATVTASSTGFTIEGTGTASVASHSGGTSEYDCTLTATLASDGTITELVFSAAFMGTTTVTCYEAEAPATYVVANDYTGTLAMTVYGTDAGEVEDLAVNVAAENEETVAITIATFDLTVEAMNVSMTIGEIEIPGVAVTENEDGTYTLANDSFEVEGVEYSETTITVSGSLEGTIDADGNASITFTLTFGSMPMPVVCVYTGAVAE